MRSCLDWHRRGVNSGAYTIVDKNDTHYPVYCDFESEATSVWTLITSHSLANKDLFSTPFYKSKSRSEDSPNWMDYRYSIAYRFYNLCKKSWNTYVISGDHLVVSPSNPQYNAYIYSIDRKRNSRYACRYFSDK